MEAAIDFRYSGPLGKLLALVIDIRSSTALYGGRIQTETSAVQAKHSVALIASQEDQNRVRNKMPRLTCVICGKKNREVKEFSKKLYFDASMPNMCLQKMKNWPHNQ